MRTFFAVLVVAAVGVVAGCSADADEPSAKRKTANRCEPSLDKRLRVWADAGFSGSVAISRGGRFDSLAAYGTADEATGRPNTVKTVFSIGSISKAFTAAAILDLVDAGKLSLSDRVGELIPALRGPAAEATVEQLLRHTSGLTGSHGADHEPLSRAAAIAAIGKLKRVYAPGRKFLYSNAGYSLLALIVDARSGMSYRAYVASRILTLPGGHVAGGFWDGEPAAPGPRAVGYLEEGRSEEMGDFRGPHWALNGNGDLAMIPRDLARWTRALFTGELIPPRAVEAITAGRFESLVGTRFFITAGGGGAVGHNAVIAWVPEGERAIAIASNTPAVSAEELLEVVGPALLAGKPIPLPRRPSGDAEPTKLKAAAGTYALRTGDSFAVSPRRGELAVSARGADAVNALFPLPRDVTRADARTNERRTMALLTGAGEERKMIESTFGRIRGIELAGTMVSGSELRTYVTVRAGSKSITAWYAVDEAGAIDAALIPAKPPALRLGPAGDGRYRPRDPLGRNPSLTVRFEGDRMIVSSRGRSVTARR